MSYIVPVLSILPNLDGWVNRERDIDRAILVDVAPDREELLISKRPIEEIRQTLKMRVESTSGHWLHRVQRRENVKLKDATTRISVIDAGQSSDSDTNTVNSAMYIVRRVGRPTLASTSSSDCDNSEAESKETSNEIVIEPTSVNMSEALVSPRPLGPTHILIAYTIPSKQNVEKPALRRQRVFSTFAETVEMSINDLLFLLNIPNLSYDHSLGQHGTVLPRRRHRELPSVLIPVPHLRTFPEVVVYLHTKNQAALFRVLIPEWARDIMHPLPPPPSPDLVFNDLDSEEYAPSALCCIPSSGSFQLKRFFKLGVFSGHEIPTKLKISAPLAAHVNMARSVNFTGVELAEAAAMHTGASDRADPLCEIVAALDALRDNLSYIGYFNKELWTELNVYRSIVLYAISYQAGVSLKSEA